MMKGGFRLLSNKTVCRTFRQAVEEVFTTKMFFVLHGNHMHDFSQGSETQCVL